MTQKATGERGRKERGNGQGTVWEVSKGVWRWQITLGYKPDGRRITASGKAPSKTAALNAASTARTAHERGLLAAPDSITVREYAEKWLARQKQLTARSVSLYRTELAYALEHIGSKRVREVRSSHLKDLMVKLAEMPMKGGGRAGAPMAPRTQAKVLTRLRSLFREAVSDQIIYVSPVDGVRKVKAPSPEAVGVVLDFEQAARLQEVGQALYAAGVCRLWPALFTAVSVGMRRGEVMGLSWEHVDLEQGVLHLRQQLKVDVKRPELGELKTRHARRDIHMPESLRAALLAHREHQAAERAAAGEASRATGAVFTTVLGEWTHPDNLKRALSSVVDWSDPAAFSRRSKAVWAIMTPEALAQLEAAVMAEGKGKRLPNISPHDLRHTYATLTLRRRVPVEVVSKTLGHARVSITLDIYRHVLESERQEHVIDLFAAPVPPRPVTPRLPN